ncbi:DUF5691 domain-containing protein [Acaryochloris sp. IP29b_bin.148]|uniref:DUF5691 domain-containing protein n=1 Tax=Acaryochloris sp. IP29b_bin.148 TaxID=2969218 RepID=UPI002612BB84|nr:DUF5691 domain-containing protein [Acaryochloris sp. IP29b_bin.148]
MPTLWETLIANALIGTDRQPPQLPTGEGPLQALLSQVSLEPEATLLQSAGILASYQQAGQCPISGSGTVPSPCSAETLSQCSDRTHHHLQTILNGEYKAVLPELLGLMAQAKQLVPPAALPALLDQGRGQTELRSRIQAVIGERGRWLAQHNSMWAYAVGQPLPHTEAGEIDQQAVENLWKTSDPPLRIDLLKTFRSLKPQAAQEMLNTTWKQEKAKDRATFLALLHANLSLADEPFLEIALNDRAQDVRTQAGTLLAGLPDSQYGQRMADRVTTYVQFEDNTVTVQLPKEDGSWKQEGLEPIPGQFGKRASLLSQIVAAVPLGKWSGEPASLIRIVESHQHGAAVLAGWTLAAQQQAHGTWAQALSQYWLSQPKAESLIEAQLIFDLLPAPDLETQLENWLQSMKSDSAVWKEALNHLTSLGPSPSFEFSRKIWAWVKSDLYPQLTQTKRAYQMRSQLQSLAHYLHPEIIHEVDAYLNTLDMEVLSNYHQDSLLNWRDTLNFRQEVWSAFDIAF